MHARYRIADCIGRGGMGTIYRAYDRLADTWVALKQLHLSLKDPAASPTSTPITRNPLRLALVSEFRLLAKLRHPHIVSVLDYGFVQETAFFTMELLTAPVPLVAAVAGQSLAVQLQALCQLLQALEYLRRHQVVHRDLKPANVMVQQGQVKVLDFGLATAEGQHSSTAGSPLYMAPEAFEEHPLTYASDLYAVGVMAYEILAGQHPFAAVPPHDLIHHIFNTPPDCTRLSGPPALQTVVARLLAKDPAARYATAAEALAALIAASGAALPLETSDTRASFIQAAQFVGREAEMHQLTGALAQAMAGQGSVWLLGGESGVGKSRLLEELRVQGLVRQALVWRGQAVSEGGQPGQMWHIVFRWLVLMTDPDDLEAGVLKPFVAQIEELLGRPVPDAPVLDSQAAQARIGATVLTLLRRATAQQPLVLLLEDLHWMREFSQGMLAWVMRAVTEMPLLIVATYRSEERPELPMQLPPANTLTLARLTQAQVTTLTSAIFGVPTQPMAALARFLYEQTEGNALFVVEALRNLAETAGLLSRVQQMPLPAQLLVGTMQQVIQQRLQRIAAHDYPWLAVAAVAGHALDLPLLHQLAGDFDWPSWLSRCAEAAVLEPRNVTWHFAHDQLRQGVLRTLPLERQRALHLTIAEGLEAAYASDLTPHLSRLVHHYGHTDHATKHWHYLNLAAQTAQAAYDYDKALNYYEQLRALGLASNNQVDFYLRYGALLEGLGRWPEAEQAYLGALAQASLGSTLAQCQKALGTLARLRGDYATALDWLNRALAHTDSAVLAQTLTEIGSVHLNRSDYAPAQTYLADGLALARALGDLPTAAAALNSLGTSAMFQGQLARAQTLFAECLALSRLLGDRPSLALTFNNLGVVSLKQQAVAEAHKFFTESLTLWRELGNKNHIGRALTNLGHLACLQGQYAAAEAYHIESIALRRELGNKPGVAVSLENLGLVKYLQGQDHAAAQRWFAESLALGYSIGNKRIMQAAMLGVAATLAAQGQAVRAVQLAAAAEALRMALNLVLEAGEQQLYDEACALGQHALGPAEFAQTWNIGHTLPLKPAVTLALADSAWQLLPNGA